MDLCVYAYWLGYWLGKQKDWNCRLYHCVLGFWLISWVMACTLLDLSVYYFGYV